MNHFKLFYDGIRRRRARIATTPPRARTASWASTWSATDSGQPYRMKVRPPCFFIFSAFRAVMGGWSPTPSAVLGSLNIIAGELDR